MLSKNDMLSRLQSGGVSLPPISFRFVESEPEPSEGIGFDARIEMSWGQNAAQFIVECKSKSTPRAFQDGLNRLKTARLPENLRPLLLVPYLSPDRLQELEREGISGIDLCGNGMVVVPGRFSVFRGGAKNLFKTSAPIKNIYRKNSSMVGRIFLSCPSHGAVQDMLREINRKNPLVELGKKKPMSLSTVSKALKSLEEDLMIERGGGIRLLQAEKLLDALSANYAAPPVKKTVRFKAPGGEAAVRGRLEKEAQESGAPCVASGRSSVGRYAVMARGEPFSVYCLGADDLMTRLSGNPADRFPNVELLETDDETVYFDSRSEGGFRWASPVQVFLELAAGDKRDRETAGQVKAAILAGLRTVSA